MIFFHSALSSHCFLHRLTPIICNSSSVSAINLFRGIPLVLLAIGFHCNILLGVLLSSIRITRPSQAILLHFINLTISAFPISVGIDLLFLNLGARWGWVVNASRRTLYPRERPGTHFISRGTALQFERSRVRFPMVPLELFIDIILPAALWPWG